MAHTHSSSGDTDGQRQYLDEDDSFSNSPCLYFNDGKVKFNNRWFDNANDNFGSASAFLSKSLFYIKGYPRTDTL